MISLFYLAGRQILPLFRVSLTPFASVPRGGKVGIGAALAPIQRGDGGHLLAAQGDIESGQIGGLMLPLGGARDHRHILGQ